MVNKISNFGKGMYKYFQLDADYTYTNHGAFGTVSKVVTQCATLHRMATQKNPQLFFSKKLPEYIEQNASALAEHLGVKGNNIAFTHSATASMNAVLRSLSLLSGEEIITDVNVYPATARILDFVCGRANCRHIKATPPAFIESVDDFVSAYLNVLTPRTRLVVLEDISAKSGLVQPIEKIIAECNKRGIAVLVDGAHSVGAIDRDLSTLGADWYIGCLHKWLGAERGSGYIYASENKKDTLRPVSISRHYYEPYPNNFDWPGTVDFAPWLTVKEAIAFRNTFDEEKFHDYCHNLVMWAANYVADSLGTQFIAPERFVNYMAPVALPDEFQKKTIDIKDIMNDLADLNVMAKIDLINGRKYVRLSAYIYNEEDDYKILVEALKTIKGKI